MHLTSVSNFTKMIVQLMNENYLHEFQLLTSFKISDADLLDADSSAT